MNASDHRPPDVAERVLRWCLAPMPAHRREWADAMRAELAHIGGTSARWRFVAGCAWAVCRVRTGEGGMKSIGMAGVAGALLMAPMVGLSVVSAGFAALWTSDSAALFGLLWTLGATAALMIATLVARTGARRPGAWSVVLRVAVLALAAGAWFAISSDQMPCFLGQPKCD